MVQSIPLSDAPAGRSLTVEAVRLGRNFQMTLTAMGISVGKQIEIRQRNGHGPLIVRLRPS